MIETSERVGLPIGILREGTYFKEVIIDEWRGIDHDALTSPTAKKNSAKAMARVLCRLIQEIPGVYARKTDPFTYAPESLVKDMFIADRDMILIQSMILSENHTRSQDITCPSCTAEITVDVDLREVVVIPFTGESTSIPFSLQRGIQVKIDNQPKTILEGTFEFPRGRHMEVISKYSGEGEMALFSRLLCETVTMGEAGRLNLTLVQRMPIRDRKILMDLLSENSPGVDLSRQICCNSCGHDFKVGVQLADFFI